jgi:hypothetical protein
MGLRCLSLKSNQSGMNFTAVMLGKKQFVLRRKT